MLSQNVKLVCKTLRNVVFQQLKTGKLKLIPRDAALQNLEHHALIARWLQDRPGVYRMQSASLLALCCHLVFGVFGDITMTWH